MKLLAIIALVATALFAEETPAMPEGVEMIEGPSGTHYAWFPEEMEISRGEAVEKCLLIGGQLADLKLGSDFDLLSKSIKGAAWINTFEEKSYSGACFAFFEGGAIAVPVGNCESKQGVLCQF